LYEIDDRTYLISNLISEFCQNYLKFSINYDFNQLISIIDLLKL